MAKKSGKRGYGLHNVNKINITKKQVKSILNKSFEDLTGMDLYKLVNKGWKVQSLSDQYGVSITSIMNRLRYL